MSTGKESADRADPFAGSEFDLSGFAPAPAKKPAAAREVIRKVSEEQNFPSRAPAKKKEATPQRRRRTGRNVQINIKATPQTIERLVSIADREGWVLGEALEHAVEALDAKLSRKAP